jgi:hypothetical protein
MTFFVNSLCFRAFVAVFFVRGSTQRAHKKRRDRKKFSIEGSGYIRKVHSINKKYKEGIALKTCSKRLCACTDYSLPRQARFVVYFKNCYTEVHRVRIENKIKSFRKMNYPAADLPAVQLWQAGLLKLQSH